MGEILSEQEMSALLSETRTAAAQAGAAGGRRFAPFSFTAPVPFSQNALDTLAGLGVRFAEAFGTRLARELRKEVAVGPAPVEVLGVTDAERLFSGGVHLRFEAEHGRRAADLVFNTEIALALIEARLGGSIAEPQPTRPLTPVEMVLLTRLIGTCGGPALSASFGTGGRPGTERSAGRTASQPADAAGAAEAAERRAAPAGAAELAERRAASAGAGERLACRPGAGGDVSGSGYASIPLQVSLESRGGLATLLLPAARAAECAAAAGAAHARTPSTGRRVPISTITKLPVRVVPRIPGGSISLGDLMALRPGLVVQLDQREGDPIEILCNGEPALRGRLIRSGAMTALEITSWAEVETAGEETR